MSFLSRLHLNDKERETHTILSPPAPHVHDVILVPSPFELNVRQTRRCHHRESHAYNVILVPSPPQRQRNTDDENHHQHHIYTKLSLSRPPFEFNARQTQTMPSPLRTTRVHNVILVPCPLQRQADTDDDHHTDTASSWSRVHFNARQTQTMTPTRTQRHLGPVSTSTPGRHRRRESPPASHIHNVILVPSPF